MRRPGARARPPCTSFVSVDYGGQQRRSGDLSFSGHSLRRRERVALKSRTAERASCEEATCAQTRTCLWQRQWETRAPRRRRRRLRHRRRSEASAAPSPTGTAARSRGTFGDDRSRLRPFYFKFADFQGSKLHGAERRIQSDTVYCTLRFCEMFS